jgi:ADP-L-glycero-D-manno-heptose 6-epimerase
MKESPTPKVYVVTGSDGFIGQNLVERLEERPYTFVDRRPTYDSVEHLLRRSYEDGVLAGVFHMGAISSTAERDVFTLLKHNVNCTDYLYQWCAWQKVPFVYASSAAVYGDGSQSFDEDVSTASLKPTNEYGWSKREADLRILSLHSASISPPRWYGVRPFNAYGPHEEHKGDMASYAYKVWRTVKEGNPIRFFGYPLVKQPMRDFVHVDDVVEIMLHLMDGQAPSGIYNAGTGHAFSFEGVAALVLKALGKSAADYPFHEVPMPEHMVEGYQAFTCARIGKLRTIGRYKKPFTDVAEGVRLYVEDLEAKFASTASQR